VKPRTKFLVGGLLILGSAGYLMASSIKETGQYYLTPGELAAKLRADPTFVDNGIKVGARVVPGSIKRDPGGRSLTFQMTDGQQTYAVAYRGIAPDTFTDGVGRDRRGAHGRRRHLPGDDAARQVRVALRERAGEVPGRPGLQGRPAGRRRAGPRRAGLSRRAGLPRLRAHPRR
jgi:cytochrome c-type biogenesis protein CcmE